MLFDLLKAARPWSLIKEENDAFGATTAVTPQKINTFVAGYVVEEMLLFFNTLRNKIQLIYSTGCIEADT